MSQLTNPTITPNNTSNHEQQAQDLTRILPASIKVYVQGSRADIRVPFVKFHSPIRLQVWRTMA